MSRRSVLLTGATGSFGKAYLNYMTNNHPNTLVYCLSRDECKQAPLIRKYADHNVQWILGDVRHPPFLPAVDLIVHAAALKHVGRAETQPEEFYRTNVEGTSNLLLHAQACGAFFIALSTDKACAPINAYGASKLMMEKMVIANGGSIVRYGNVVGSRGSLIPFVMQLAERKQPIPITHPDMTRFWIHLTEAVDLVNYAYISFMEEGKRGIFIPMAQAMRVVDLVQALAPDSPMYEIGIGAGEKLHESMLTADEAVNCYRDLTRLIISRQPIDDLPKVHHRFTYSSEHAVRLEADEIRDLVSTMDLVDGELVCREELCTLQ
jgi:UDP-N-acetylglucosamine 4,6-dehydratase